MKRYAVIFVLLLMLAVSEPALAFDFGGHYIAPKIIWSYQVQDNVNALNNGWGPWHGSGAGNKSDNAWGGGLAVGYDFNAKFGLPVRAEVEYAVRSQSRVSGRAADSAALGILIGDYFDVTRKLSVTTLFANVFYDFKTGTAFTPYVGGGLGAALIHVKDSVREGYYGYAGSGSKDVSNFAWNLAAGVNYSFDANWSLDLGYRYCNFGQVRGAIFSDGAARHQVRSYATSHEVLLGARYTF
jgi:outer membrane autotransporter protein